MRLSLPRTSSFSPPGWALFQPLLVFALLAVLITGLGSALYLHLASQAKKESATNLQALAQLKQQAVSSWLQERRADVQATAESPLFQANLQAMLRVGGSHQAEAQARLQDHLHVLTRRYGYNSISLISPSGQPILYTQASTDRHPLHKPMSRDASFSRYLQRVVQHKTPALIDLHRHEDGYVHLGVMAPVLHNGQLLAAVIFDLDARQFLYPYIQTWPLPSLTGETLLVRREGNEVLFLNDLRHRPNSAMQLRASMDNKDLPSSRAFRGEHFTEGKDYRGKPVIAAVKTVPETGWLLIAKMDTDEAYASLRSLAWITGLGVLLALFITGFALLSVWQRQRLREAAEVASSEQSLRLILDHSADAVFIADDQGHVLYANKRACDLLGYTPAELQARSLLDLGPEDERAMQQALFSQRLMGLGYFAGEIHLQSSKGKRIPVDINAVVLPDGRIFGSARDISARKRQETMLATYQNQLEDMVQKRTAELEESRNRAETLARVKSDFLANMSHELRTPLNGVLGFAELGLRSSEDTAANKKALTAFHKILDSGRLLLNVINDILDFSKIEAGRLKTERIAYAIEPMLHHSLDLVRLRAQSKGLGLTLECAPDLPQATLGDPLRVQQILLNLLGNAVKFTTHGYVSLTASLEDAYLVFRVSDTGIGMNEEQIRQLFQPFTQADTSTTRKFGGTGLGLSISKQLLGLMLGEVQVESHPGAGSTFTVRLPYLPAELAESAAAGKSQTTLTDGGVGSTLNDTAHATEHAEHADHAEHHDDADADPYPLHGIRLLVAEDNEVNQEVIYALLTDAGAEVVMADNGQIAVEAVKAEGAGAFALVLMDVQMPVMNGFDATRAIHALDPDIHIIGQTAHTLTEEREKCLQAGMADQICKPLDPDELIATVLMWARQSAY